MLENRFDSMRKERDRVNGKIAIIVKQLHGATDIAVYSTAVRLVRAGMPFPPYRDAYPGEVSRSHAEFVRDRLRLVFAMRRAATELGIHGYFECGCSLCERVL